MKDISRIANLIIVLIVIAQPVYGQGVDYTMRNYTAHSCQLFANDAYHAADNFKEGAVLQKVLKLINDVPVAESKKHRMFQAIQLVWKNQLDNPTLAYSLAMGLCLKPKRGMAPMDEPQLSSLRTRKEYF